jgi:transposase
VRRCWKDVHHAQALSPGVPGGRDPGRAQPRPGVRIKDIAADFGISESCLTNWLTAADVEDGVKPGAAAVDNAELREATKRIRLLEQENEVLRRAAAYLSQANLPGK